MNTTINHYDFGFAKPGFPSSCESFFAWLKHALDAAMARIRDQSFLTFRAPPSHSILFGDAVHSKMDVGHSAVSIGAHASEDVLRVVLGRLTLPMFRDSLDDHSAERVAMLLECKPGWNGADASPLSLDSLFNCVQFLASVNVKKLDVGVFMNDEGFLVLNWPKPEGSGMVEITFMRSERSLYISGWDDDVVYAHDDRAFEEELQNFL